MIFLFKICSICFAIKITAKICWDTGYNYKLARIFCNINKGLKTRDRTRRDEFSRRLEKWVKFCCLEKWPFLGHSRCLEKKPFV